MNLFGMLRISASALSAERVRAEVVAANIANSETTRSDGGGPYRRQQVVFRSSLEDAWTRGEVANAVEVADVIASNETPVLRYQPDHPDADAKGFVQYPAINPIEEMVDLVGAARSYQLNVSALQATKNMLLASLEILRS